MATRNLYFLFTSLLVFYNSCSKEPVDIDKYLTKKVGFYYEKNDDRPYSGPIFSIYSDGAIKDEGHLENGKRHGAFIFWYQNGNMEKTGNSRILCRIYILID